MCAMTQSHVCHDSVTRVRHSLQQLKVCVCETITHILCAMIHLYVSHDSVIYVSSLSDMCDMTHTYIVTTLEALQQLKISVCERIAYICYMA